MSLFFCQSTAIGW